MHLYTPILLYKGTCTNCSVLCCGHFFHLQLNFILHACIDKTRSKLHNLCVWLYIIA